MCHINECVSLDPTDVTHILLKCKEIEYITGLQPWVVLLEVLIFFMFRKDCWIPYVGSVVTDQILLVWAV